MFSVCLACWDFLSFSFPILLRSCQCVLFGLQLLVPTQLHQRLMFARMSWGWFFLPSQLVV